MSLACASLFLLPGCAADSRVAGPGGAQPADTVTLVAPARPADDFVNSVGLNLHLSYFRTAYGTLWDQVRSRLLALGVRHVRDGGNVVADDRWMQTVYGRMRELADSGVRFNLIMRPAEGSTDYSNLSQFGRLLNYAAPAVESFEGLNEHDLSGRSGWVNEVRQFQQALFIAVRSDPRTVSLPVLGPSMGRPDKASAVGDLSAYLDAGSIHPYPGGRTPLANLAQHETRVRVLSGARPLIATETGYHTAMQSGSSHPPISERAMSHYVPRLFLEYFNAGISRSYLYELVDEGTNPSEREQGFGLLRADGSPKPAYTALRNLIGLLRDPGPAFPPGALPMSLVGDTTAVHHTLLVKRDGTFALVLWLEVSVYDLSSRRDLRPAGRDIMVLFPGAATRVREFHPLVTSATVRQSDGVRSLNVQVTAAPLVLEISP